MASTNQRNKNYTNIAESFMYRKSSSSRKDMNFYSSHKNNENTLDDPIFTGFTFDIDTLHSPLFYTGDNNEYGNIESLRGGGGSSLASKIETRLKTQHNQVIMSSTNNYEVVTMSVKDMIRRVQAGYGLQNLFYLDAIPYGAVDYIYMVDKDATNSSNGIQDDSSSFVGGGEPNRSGYQALVDNAKNVLNKGEKEPISDAEVLAKKRILDSKTKVPDCCNPDGTLKSETDENGQPKYTKADLEKAKKSGDYENFFKHLDNRDLADDLEKKFNEEYAKVKPELEKAQRELMEIESQISEKKQEFNSKLTEIQNKASSLLTKLVSSSKSDTTNKDEKVVSKSEKDEAADAVESLTKELEELQKEFNTFVSDVDKGQLSSNSDNTDGTKTEEASKSNVKLEVITGNKFKSGDSKYDSYIKDYNKYVKNLDKKSTSDTSSAYRKLITDCLNIMYSTVDLKPDSEAAKKQKSLNKTIKDLTSKLYGVEENGRPCDPTKPAKGSLYYTYQEARNESYNDTFSISTNQKEVLDDYINNQDDMIAADKYTKGMNTTPGVTSAQNSNFKTSLKSTTTKSEKIYETDADGNYVYEKDANGNYIYDVVYEADGKTVKTANYVDQETGETVVYGLREKRKKIKESPGVTVNTTTDTDYTNIDNEGVNDYLNNKKNKISSTYEVPQTVYDLLGFISGMKKIAYEYPYMMQSISGLDEAYKKYFSMKDPFQGSGDDKITITCYEALDLRVSSMFNKYLNACYDHQYKRERLPINLRRFQCSVFVHDIRNFRSALSKLYSEDDSVDDASIKIAELAKQYASVVEFKFFDCEIVPEETGSIFDSVSNAEGGDMKQTNFTFTYGNCVVNFLPFGDMAQYGGKSNDKATEYKDSVTFGTLNNSNGKRDDYKKNELSKVEHYLPKSASQNSSNLNIDYNKYQSDHNAIDYERTYRSQDDDFALFNDATLDYVNIPDTNINNTYIVNGKYRNLNYSRSDIENRLLNPVMLKNLGDYYDDRNKIAYYDTYNPMGYYYDYLKGDTVYGGPFLPSAYEGTAFDGLYDHNSYRHREELDYIPYPYEKTDYYDLGNSQTNMLDRNTVKTTPVSQVLKQIVLGVAASTGMTVSRVETSLNLGSVFENISSNGTTESLGYVKKRVRRKPVNSIGKMPGYDNDPIDLIIDLGKVQ